MENSSQTCRVLLADDHDIVLEGLQSALESLTGFEVVGKATSGRQAVAKSTLLRPDIVVMDVSMPGMNGVEATKEIKRHLPEVRIVIYTMFSDKEYVLELFRAGIDGYVLKQDPLADLVLALDAVRSGGTYFSTEAPKVLSEHLRGDEAGLGHERSDILEALSRRERQVFQLLADGMAVKDIAQELYISPKTVESHKYHIMAKLGVDSVTEMTKLAIRENLIEL
ncbi:MAG: response regulator transcription factor [Thermoleophilia bacterium]